MNILYRTFKTSDREMVGKMMKGLYEEDPGESQLTEKKIDDTFAELAKYPEKGTLLIIDSDGHVAGYCLVIYYWSNEYGGNILTIDELYLLPEFRNKGIGRTFIKTLISNKLEGAVAIDLEVTPSNNRARKLYEEIGFKFWRNTYMRYLLEGK